MLRIEKIWLIKNQRLIDGYLIFALWPKEEVTMSKKILRPRTEIKSSITINKGQYNKV